VVSFLVASLWLGGLGLTEGEQPVAPADTEAPTEAPVEEPAVPADDRPANPIVPAAIGMGAMLGLLLSRREGPGTALMLEAPEENVVVFVPGHGQGNGQDAFEDLVDLMGIDPENTRFFDHRLAGGWPDAEMASQYLRVEDAASSLNSYLGAVAEEGRPIYLVGFSKGGATIAHLIAAWDDGAYGASESVAGAALLDPPMAVGAHGWAQSAGRFWGSIPDDGGYDPVRCDFMWFGCEDARDNLGGASGVDVVVVRNPRAGVTSFSDFPEALRIYNAIDDGPGLADQLWRNPFGLPARISRAHEAVLDDPEVARCLVAEMWDPGSCELPRHEPFRYPVWRKPVAARADRGIWPI
jgi:hypothetical protein